MKTWTLVLFVLGFASPLFALDKVELDKRMRTLADKFEAMQAKPDKRIPAETLRKAQGVVLLDRTKAGFLFAYQGGSGVALLKQPDSAQWSAAAFVAANEASLGFQIGGEQNFFVILLMNTNAIRLLTEPNFEFGGEARGTAGESTSGVGGTVSSRDEPVLVFNDRTGLYGGAAVKGGAVSPDDKANQIYYGQFLTMKEILIDRKVQPSETATALAAAISKYSRVEK
jgi:lipid-binding SYLF domain-containing protein